MTDPIGAEPGACAQDGGEVPALDAAAGKAVWMEPKLVRLDIGLTQTAFNTVPDGDTNS